MSRHGCNSTAVRCGEGGMQPDAAASLIAIIQGFADED